MKNTCLLLFLFFSQFAWAQDADQILGQWQSEDGEATIEITKSGQKYVGKIIAIGSGQATKDIKNPDPKLRNRPIIGIEILSDLIYASGKWKGKAYAPKRGMSTNCEVKLLSINAMELKASKYGYSQKKIWKRL
jgi:uncharacterized protein (DUF2147 family)